MVRTREVNKALAVVAATAVDSAAEGLQPLRHFSDGGQGQPGQAIAPLRDGLVKPGVPPVEGNRATVNQVELSRCELSHGKYLPNYRLYSPGKTAFALMRGTRANCPKRALCEPLRGLCDRAKNADIPQPQHQRTRRHHGAE